MQASGGVWTRAEDIIPNPYYDPEYGFPYDQQEWYDEWYKGRNYILFGILAGVRGYGPPISESKGFPQDACEATRKEFESWDNWGAHTPYWYSLKELEDNVDRFKDPEVYGQEFIDDVIVRMRKVADEELEGDPEKVRIVFWFDN